jgi:hypothetical protein
MVSTPHEAPEGPYRIIRRNAGAGVPGKDDWVFLWKTDGVVHMAHDRWPGLFEERLPDGSFTLYASDYPDRDVYLQRLAELATCDSAWRHHAGHRLRTDAVWADEWPEVLRSEGLVQSRNAGTAVSASMKRSTPRAPIASRRSKAARSRTA